jgi:CIC family chloride channel protein
MNDSHAAAPESGMRKSPSATAPSPSDRLRSAALMLSLAFLVGLFGGFGAIVFKAIIAFVHNLFFYGVIDLRFDPNVHMPASPWGALVILVPVVGSFLVTWITITLAPEARGHGVPEVLNAIYYRQGKIRPVVVIAKAFASAISIGSGGSVGREGPIVQIGSAFGSVLGQIIAMPTRQRITLIAAGAAAGIAATFNAPIGGMAFAIELLLVSISANTIGLVAVATVTATYIGRLYGGMSPSFDVPTLAVYQDHVIRLYALLLCLPLGPLVGLAAAGFIRSIYIAEDGFAKAIKNDYLRHFIGMLLVGCALYAFLRGSGHYYVGGVGYATVLDVLRGSLADPWFLGLLFLAKLLMTDLTLGSGASGGVFSPSLFLGATLGATFGNGVAALFPSLGLSPVIYTIAGMAAMVGGTTGAVLTAIVMTFEQTRDYSVILPIILTVSLAHLVRIRLCPESIYTLKLTRRGAYVPQGLQAAITHRSHARRIMSTDFRLVNFDDFAAQGRRGKDDPRYTIIVHDGEVLGLVRDELLHLHQDGKPETVMDVGYFSATPHTRWPLLMRGMRAANTETVLVFERAGTRRAGDLLGVITPRELAMHAGADAELLD